MNKGFIGAILLGIAAIALSGLTLLGILTQKPKAIFGSGGGQVVLTSTLTDISNLTAANNNFIVGNGTTWVAQSGATVRTSAGLGTTDNPTFGVLTVTSCTGCGGAFPFTSTASGNSTSTTLIFGNGFISNASSTIGSTLQATGLVTLQGGFISNASSTISSTLQVTGLATFQGFISNASSSIQRLQVAGQLSASSTIDVGGASTATSTVASALDSASIIEADRYIAISSTASSTFGQGINLTGGCFAISGVCVGGASAASNSGTFTVGENVNPAIVINHGLGATPSRLTIISNGIVCNAAATANEVSMSFGTSTAILTANTFQTVNDASDALDSTNSSTTAIVLHYSVAGSLRAAAYVSALGSTSFTLQFYSNGADCVGGTAPITYSRRHYTWIAEK